MTKFNVEGTMTGRFCGVADCPKTEPKVTAYVMGKAVSLTKVSNPGGVVLEVELYDGRTVQLSVDNDGRVFVRGWGNVPGKVGNGNSLTLNARLMPEAPTHCATCYDKLDLCGCGK